MAKPIKKLKSAEKNLVTKLSERRQLVETKFPFVFGVATTFGVVSTLYGFEKLIDRSQWLSENPWLLLLIGLATLVATGAAYRKLN